MSRIRIVTLLAQTALLVVALVGRAAAQPTPTPDGCDGHRVRFVNQCDHPVWLGELGNGTSTACMLDTDCSDIQFCAVTTCTDDTACTAISCTQASDCPGPSPSCVSGLCTPVCDTGSNLCYCNPGGPACAANGVCQGTPGQETCQGGLCTFENILPHAGNAKKWKLAAAGEEDARSLSMCLPTGWGGRFWARTGCTEGSDTLNCTTGQCGAPNGLYSCKTSPTGVTLFEPTLDAPAGGGTFVDYYDVSLVSGYNVQIKAEPSIPGCAVSECTSDLNRTCPNPLRVKNGACTTDSDCTDGGVCLAGECVIGCLDPCDACKASTPPAGLRCDKFRDLYCCTGSHTDSCNAASYSCFDDADCRNLSSGQLDATCDRTTHLCKKTCTNDGDCPTGTCQNGQCAPPLVMCAPVTMACPANSTCDSSIVPGSDVCAPGADCCGPYNRKWLRAARKAGKHDRPFTKIFKEACPAAYSFQYDDPSSSYTCNDPSGGEIDYKVTFCP